MAAYVLRTCKCYLGEFDISGDLNKMELQYGAEMKENTVFGATFKSRIAGLLDVSASIDGYFQAGDTPDQIDHIIWDKFAVANVPVSIAPTDGADGEYAFSFNCLTGEYSPGAAIGEILAFTASAQGVGPLIRGTILGTGAKTVTGSGTARNLGEISATQYLYGVLHVVAVTGTTPTLTMKIQSDDAEGFASPIDRITFTAATGITSQWATSVAGPITDTWWRANWTIGGTTPSFTVVVIAGIR